MVKKLAWWWLYESKHVATLVVGNKISCVLTEITLHYLSEKHIGMIPIKIRYWYLTVTTCFGLSLDHLQATVHR